MESHNGCVVLALLPGNIISSTHGEDVYAPASSSICNRLLPAVIMSELCGDTAIMGAFDISDAYLQVDQPTPKKIRVVGTIIFQVLCKQTWVVRFVQKFLHYSNCQMTKGSCWLMLTMSCLQ